MQAREPAPAERPAPPRPEPARARHRLEVANGHSGPPEPTADGAIGLDPGEGRPGLRVWIVELFELLLFLARHPGQVFTRDQLMEYVWQYSFYLDTSTVTVHIRRLRAKLEPDPERPRFIQTIWGVGYRFEP